MSKKHVILKTQSEPSKKRKPLSQALSLGSSPGRPRSDAAREAILKATNDLLEEAGFANLAIFGATSSRNASMASVPLFFHQR